MTAVQLVAGVQVKVGGQPLDPETAAKLVEARVEDNLMLPDAFSLKLRDPDFKLVDGTLFEIGAKIELHYAPYDARGGSEGVFKGEVATIAPQFEREGSVLLVRGFDLSHRLNRSRRRRTFQDMTASDIAAKIISSAGVPADVKSTRDVYPFEQQSNETDWDYLWRLAARVGHEVACVDGTIHFRPPGTDAGAPVKLEWGAGLLAFHPRATAVQQVGKVTVSGWDPKSRRRVSADAQSPRLDSRIGLDRDKASTGLGAGEIAVADEIVTSQGEATVLAQSTLDRLANAWLEADGRCHGNPSVRAGARVQISGIGARFAGDYLVTRSTHVIRDRGGYETHFEISGRSRRTLLDLLTPRPRADYATSLVIGVVTNNDDPDKMGRVRVKFPGLDERNEGWWARVASPAASGRRGLLMMPLVDDEVVVGFEHGDPRRPFVLGALWNGRSKPDELAAKGGGKPDGSLNVRSDKKISLSSAGDTELVSEAKLTADAKGAIEVTGQSSIKVESTGGEIKISTPGASVTIGVGGQVTVKGTQITLESTGQLSLQSSGVLQLRGSQVMLG